MDFVTAEGLTLAQHELNSNHNLEWSGSPPPLCPGPSIDSNVSWVAPAKPAPSNFTEDSLILANASFKNMRMFAFNNYGDTHSMNVAELKVFDESGGPIATPCTPAPASCTASSVWDAIFPASNAFDGTSSVWHTAYQDATDQWIQISFQQPVVISSFSITSDSNFPTRRPKDFKIQGSNAASPAPGPDSSDWVTRRHGTAGTPTGAAAETAPRGWV
jgi:hypothetical protein